MQLSESETIITPVKIVIVDDHDLIVHGTQKFLEDSKMFEVVGVASDGQQALALLKGLATQHKLPDVLITDIHMPKLNGVELTKRVRQRWGKKIKIVAVTAYQDRDFLMALLQQGVDGYIAKAAKSTEFLSSLRRVVAGEIVVEGVFDAIAIGDTEIGTGTTSGSAATTPVPGMPPDAGKIQQMRALTERERNILQFILMGFDSAKTAEETGLSRGTIQNYYTDIFNKLRTTRNALLLEDDSWKKALIWVRRNK